MCFNSLKAYLKRSLCAHGQTLVGARRQFLLNCCPDALGLTAATTLSSYSHVRTVTVRRALLLEDL